MLLVLTWRIKRILQICSHSPLLGKCRRSCHLTLVSPAVYPSCLRTWQDHKSKDQLINQLINARGRLLVFWDLWKKIHENLWELELQSLLPNIHLGCAIHESPHIKNVTQHFLFGLCLAFADLCFLIRLSRESKFYQYQLAHGTVSTNPSICEKYP